MPITIRNIDAPGATVLLTPTATAEPQASGCCGGEAPTGVDACCALDADVKSAGGSGCGCGTSPDVTAAPVAAPAAKGCC
jgi:hypothetical protein